MFGVGTKAESLFRMALLYAEVKGERQQQFGSYYHQSAWERESSGVLRHLQE